MLIKSASTPTNFQSSDVLFSLKKQTKMREALCNYSLQTPKWYSYMNMDRPIVVNAYKKEVLSCNNNVHDMKNNHPSDNISVDILMNINDSNAFVNQPPIESDEITSSNLSISTPFSFSSGSK